MKCICEQDTLERNELMRLTRIDHLKGLRETFESSGISSHQQQDRTTTQSYYQNLVIYSPQQPLLTPSTHLFHLLFHINQFHG